MCSAVSSKKFSSGVTHCRNCCLWFGGRGDDSTSADDAAVEMVFEGLVAGGCSVAKSGTSGSAKRRLRLLPRCRLLLVLLALLLPELLLLLLLILLLLPSLFLLRPRGEDDDDFFPRRFLMRLFF